MKDTIKIVSGSNENIIKKQYPELWGKVKEKFPDIPFMEALYRFTHDIIDTPVCACGKPLKFYSYTRGYQQYCSAKCSNSSQSKIDRTKETCMERYGGVAPACSKEVSGKAVRVARDHGYDFHGRTGPLSEEAKAKMRKTNLERYGSENAMQYFARKKIFEKYNFVKDIIGDIFVCHCINPSCNKCQERIFEIPRQNFFNRLEVGCELCPKKFPIKSNRSRNTSIELFVHDILDSFGIKYLKNDRKTIPGIELDIYIPDYNLAIECNGVYWHSLKPKDYHYGKWKACREQNIQLITLWEDQILNKPDIIRNIIVAKLGLCKNKIGARRCSVKEIPSKDAQIFFDLYHLQGRCKASVYCGLYYGDELMSVMSFSPSKSRVGIGSGKETDTWELVRYCVKGDTEITGGSAKLFKWFTTHHSGDIVSFSSNDISDGGVYERLGFHKIGETPTSYWYIEPRTLKRYHRFSFTKGSLVKKGYDPSKTEFQITDEMGMIRIYDSGQQKWIYENK